MNKPRSMDELDRAVRARIRAYFRDLDDGQDTILSEEDAIGAAGHADQIYLDHTDMPAADCIDRAMDLAFEEKARCMKLYEVVR